jgi:hypothetical protein
MANQALIAQFTQLANQMNALQQTARTLQTSNNTLTTRIFTLEAETPPSPPQTGPLQLKLPTLEEALRLEVLRGAGAAAPVTIVVTPAMVNHQDLINYMINVGAMIYDEGCKKLTTEFDIKLSGTIIYITKLQAKCIKIGWHMGTQQIINLTNTAGSTINVFHQYSQIDAAMLQAHCKVFCKSTGALFQARARQNNTMMGECIMKMLTPAARIRLLPF